MLLAFLVYANDEKVRVIRSAKGLKEVNSKKITGEKDRAKMVLVRPIAKSL